MPRSLLSEKQKLEIITLRAQRWPLIKISKKIKKSEFTIRNFLHRYKKRKSIQNQNSGGRHKKVDAKTRRRLIRHAKTHRRDSVVKIKEVMGLSQVTGMTINRILLDVGLKAYKPTKKPLLTQKQRSNRVKFARKYRSENEDFFEEWIFSDESSYTIGAMVGGTVRRTRAESQLPECMGGLKKWGTKIFFWGAINSKGVSDIVFIEGKMDSELYIKVLKNGLLPMYNQLGLNKKEVNFQEDGDPKHQSATTKKWKEKTGIKFISDWPANSPDLNPIENLWAILKRNVSRLKPTGTEATKQCLLEEWRRLDADGVVLDIIRSMPKRIKEVIKTNGHPINY